MVSVYCDLNRHKKKLASDRKQLEYLESFRVKIIKYLKVMLRKAGIIDEIRAKRKYRRLGITPDQPHDEIIELFNLKPILDKVNKRICWIRKKLAMLQSISIQTVGGKNPIQPPTLIALVWLSAMKSCRKTKRYEDICNLTEWFAKHHPKIFAKRFYRIYGRLPILSTAAIRRAEERYIAGRTPRQKKYKAIIKELLTGTYD
jgi:hypothetical protein